MLVFAVSAIGLIGLFNGQRLVRRRRQRRAERDPFTTLIRSRELRELDAHLDVIAELEMRWIEARVSRYVAGLAGHVVVISESRQGVVLELSDGQRLALGGINRSTLSALRLRAPREKLRPARVERDSFSYRLLLRGEVGSDIELTMRRLALAP